MKRKILSAVVGALIGFSSAAFANVYDFSTPVGATAGGQPVNATAHFVTSSGQIALTLTNLQANPISIIQAISDIFFTASGVTGGGGLIAPTAFSLVTFGNDTSPLSGNPQWLSTNTSGNFHLDALAGPATGPATLIIGPGTPTGGSIVNNSPHNPFIDQTATFTFTGLTGATSETVISNVSFSFGTGGASVDVPIPAALWLFGSGLFGLVAIARRRQGVSKGGLAAA